MTEEIDVHKQALTLQAEFIAEGIIEQPKPGHWRLTAKGEEEGRKVWEKLSPREEALSLFYVLC